MCKKPKALIDKKTFDEIKEIIKIRTSVVNQKLPVD